MNEPGTAPRRRWAGRAWRAFRRWPPWLQAIGWLLGFWLLIPLRMWASSYPWLDR